MTIPNTLKKKGLIIVKRFLLTSLALIVVLSIFAFSTSTTHAATNTHLSKISQKVTPAASGGGCDIKRTSGAPLYDILAAGCISYSYSQGFLPDAYVSYFANPNTPVLSCTASLMLYTSDNVYLAGQSWNCASAASAESQNVHYQATYPVLAESVKAEIFVSIRYTNHNISYVGSDSPVINY